MKKVLRWRERRDAWFRTMFAKSFAEWHEVRDRQEWGRGIWDYTLPMPVLPKAKHPDHKALVERMEAVERAVCEHEFGDVKKGCLTAIFCSKCGSLHPDWERCFSYTWSDDLHCDINEDGTKYKPELTIDGKDYRTVASKPKDQKK